LTKIPLTQSPLIPNSLVQGLAPDIDPDIDPGIDRHMDPGIDLHMDAERGLAQQARAPAVTELPPDLVVREGLGAEDAVADNVSAYAAWGLLVERIHSGETDGMEELYQLFSKGIRFYLCRQLGPQELDDKVHDTFVVVVQAIRRGELREPQRLMGFVRTVVRRQVAAHIDKAVHSRREQMDLDSSARVADPHGNPEEAAIFRQRADLIQRVLGELSVRDREILTRFYLQEQGQEQICSEMALTETQFRLLKSRAKARFGELGKKKLTHRALNTSFMRTSAGMSH
jgi:RNA polymerase sigma-70 factor (ECF subfamily)